MHERYTEKELEQLLKEFFTFVRNAYAKQQKRDKEK
jgi:hypothetical protein